MNNTLKAYRRKPLNSKDVYQKSNFVPVSVPSSAQEVYMNASNINFFTRAPLKSSYSKKTRRGLTYAKGLSDSQIVIMPATSQG